MLSDYKPSRTTYVLLLSLLLLLLLLVYYYVLAFFPPHIPHNYAYALYKLECNILTLFFHSCFSKSQFCLFLLIDNNNLKAPSIIRISNCRQFSAARKNCPSTRHATTANLMCSAVDVFS
jgi:hypothetical protein